jgi:hypothetical protein
MCLLHEYCSIKSSVKLTMVELPNSLLNHEQARPCRIPKADKKFSWSHTKSNNLVSITSVCMIGTHIGGYEVVCRRDGQLQDCVAI